MTYKKRLNLADRICLMNEGKDHSVGNTTIVYPSRLKMTLSEEFCRGIDNISDTDFDLEEIHVIRCRDQQEVVRTILVSATLDEVLVSISATGRTFGGKGRNRNWLCESTNTYSEYFPKQLATRGNICMDNLIEVFQDRQE